MSRLPYPRGKCRHCGRILLLRGRGLCGTCYLNRSIRNQYATLRTNRTDATANKADISEAELDQLISQQRPTMPGEPHYPRVKRWRPPLVKLTYKE